MQSNRILNLELHILQVFMQMCVAVTLTNLLLHGFMHYPTFHVFNTLYIGIPVFVYYVTGCVVKNGKLAMLIHLLALGTTFVIPKGPVEELVMIFVPALLFMVLSLKRSSNKPLFLFDIGVFIGCYLIGGSIEAESVLVIPIYGVVFYLVCFIIWFNIENLNHLIAENGSAKSFNTEQAINVNSVLLVIFVSICVIIMFLMPGSHLQELFYRIISIAIAGISVVVRFLFHRREQADGAIDLPVEEEGIIKIAKEPQIMMQMSEGSAVLNWIAGIFATVIFIFLMVMVIRAIKDIKYKRRQGMDVKEFVKPVSVKEKAKEHRSKAKFFRNHSNEQILRMLYQKRIRKNLSKPEQVERHLAPVAITTKVLGWNEHTKIMTQLYEKARYSCENVTKEDIDLFEHHSKNK